MYENKRAAVIDFRIATRADGAEEITEYSGDASCVETEGAYYASFEERIEGADEPMQTLLKAEEILALNGENRWKLTLTRRGPIRTKMEFMTGQVTHCPYQTPVGLLLFDIETLSTEFSRDYDGAYAAAAYRVLQDDVEVSQADFSLRITYVAQA